VTDDLHPYDNRERRFRYDDDSRTRGRELVARILRLPVAPTGARFDIAFFSGGVGVFDNVAIAIAASPDAAAAIATRLQFAPPGDFTGDDFADLEWLVGAADGTPFELALAGFVAEHRHAFQPDYVTGDPIWFETISGVNHWSVLWYSRGELAYLSYDQG
jgi:hypothetical protein